MNESLESARLKLCRAKVHLEALNAKVAVFIEGRPYAFFVDVNADKTEHVFRIQILEDPNPTIPVVLGDYIHNLRSALDNLAWSLALKSSGGKLARFDKGQVAPRHISFPIHRNAGAFVQAEFWQYVHPRYLGAIQDFQPYNGTYKDPLTHPLTRLQKLSNIDKHRSIHRTLVSQADTEPGFWTEDCEIAGSAPPPIAKGVPLENGGEVARVTVRVTGSDPKVNMHTFPVDIAFGDSPRTPQENLIALYEITSDIIERCQPFFN